MKDEVLQSKFTYTPKSEPMPVKFNTKEIVKWLKECEREQLSKKDTFQLVIKFVHLKKRNAGGRIGKIKDNEYQIEIDKRLTLDLIIKSMFHEFSHFVQDYVELNCGYKMTLKEKETVANYIGYYGLQGFKIIQQCKLEIDKCSLKLNVHEY